jgi:hypothetical protein
MTPLKPIENTTRVRGVPSKRYPLNRVCAHPECDRTDVTAHHIFGRPPGPDSDSWFVEIGGGPEGEHGTPAYDGVVIPAVTGLCGSGTTGHHGDLEEHRAWVKYEDGEFVWYDRSDGAAAQLDIPVAWIRLDPLNPQPGSVEGKPKRKPRKRTGPTKRTYLVAPEDDPEAVDRLKDKIEQLQEKFNRAGHEVGPTVTVERALDYVLLNAGTDDF